MFATACSPRSWLTAMTAVGLVGGSLAITRTTDTVWQPQMPVSRLGLDTGAAGILTVTLLGLGFILLALGISLERTFASLRSAGRLGPRAEWLLTLGFLVAGVAVSLTGLFRIDGGVSLVIHNLAGFTIPIALMTTVVSARLALGGLGRRFDRMSAVILASIVMLFVAADQAHLLPYALMELTCFALIGAWLWLFEARLRRLIGE